MLANYRLLDFGDGRKLETIDGYMIDRPSPAAIGFSPRERQMWREADARFDGEWQVRTPPPDSLVARCGAFQMPVTLKPFGHLGIFPEQSPNWDWISECVRNIGGAPQVLNLFAYTGASSMAALSAGASVAHVDASKPSVQNARAAAAASGLADRPIRYLVDDGPAFVARELRRGRRYQGFILDPPAYGHGPKGEAWRIERDLHPLLMRLADLRAEESSYFCLITGHSESPAAVDIQRWLVDDRRFAKCQWEAGWLDLQCDDGRQLNAGWFVRGCVIV